MKHYLENGSLQLKVDTAQARWSLISRQAHGPAIEEAQISTHYRQGRRQQRALTRWPAASVSEHGGVASLHGPLQTLQMQTGPDDNGLLYTLTFGLPENEPLLLWKIGVDNQGERPVRLERIELLSAGFIYHSRSSPHGRIVFAPQTEKPKKKLPTPDTDKIRKIPTLKLPGDYAFYSNGWQSWSNSQVYAPDEHYKRTRLGLLRAPIIANPDAPKPKRAGMFASDMFGVLGDREQRHGILLGFLAQKQQFGSLEAWIGSGSPAVRLWANGDEVKLDPGKQIETDWACALFLHLDTHDPLGPYLEAVAREHDLLREEKFSKRPPVGWCSWYHYFRQVSAEDIRRNLRTAAEEVPELPLEVIQIDDGYEAQVGDWLQCNENFPQGLTPLAAEIRAEGFTPGIWLAPFLVNPKSDLARNHPDWLLRGRLRRPVNAGHLWGKFHSALDLTHPEALNYVSEVINTAVNDWGFGYLKLDFLYAGALPGRYRDATQTRAQALRSGLETIRAAAGEQVFVLGCGCPLGPSIGLVDGMRIGADVAHHWEPKYRGLRRVFRNEADLPSARNAIHNSLTRAALHRRWWINDPDCLLLGREEGRNEKTALTEAETQSLATVIAMTGGSLMLSDPLADLAPERVRMAECLLPLMGKRAHVLDWFDRSTPTRLQVDLEGATGGWHLLAVFNWTDSPQDIRLRWQDFYLNPKEHYLAREFWSGAIYEIAADRKADGKLTIPSVPAHGAILLAARKHRSYHPEYLGSNLHISQGMEVSAWNWKQDPAGKRSDSAQVAGQLRFQLQRPGRAEGAIELYLPAPPQAAHLDGNPVSWQPVGEARYQFGVAFEVTADVEIII